MEINLLNFYIVATPIGNFKDISVRATEILKKIDFVVCEEENEYKKLFGRLEIKPIKFILCNEHNEHESIELTLELLKKGEIGALISDCGTPLIEDPGFELINSLRRNNYKITSIPGANSIITGITLSPFKIKDFYFAGFLPKKNEARIDKLINILKRNETIILMEAPYRLKNIIDLLKIYLKNRKIYIPFNLTMEDEEIFYGFPEEIGKILDNRKINKGEFLIFIETRNK